MLFLLKGLGLRATLEGISSAEDLRCNLLGLCCTGLVTPDAAGMDSSTAAALLRWRGLVRPGVLLVGDATEILTATGTTSSW